MLIPALFLLAGCGDDGELRAKEDETILKYLTGAPLNYTEEDYTVNEGVYRVITDNFFDAVEGNTYDPPVISDGDTAALMFAIYTFTGTTPAAANLVFTNVKDLINKDINPEYWPEDPIRITVGNKEIIRGIDISLPGCRLGDTAIIIIPSGMAYGTAEIGIVGSDKMLYCLITVTGVNDEDIDENIARII